jgi:hypothetical protein
MADATGRGGARFHRFVRRASIAGIFSLVGTRALYYAVGSLPSAADEAFRNLVRIDLLVSFVLGAAGAVIGAIAVPVVLVFLLVRPRSLVTRDGNAGTWTAAPRLRSLAWVLLCCETWLLDLNPDLAALGAVSLLLAAVLARLSRSRAGVARPWLSGATWAGFAAGALFVAWDPADRVGTLVWLLLLLAFHLARKKVALRDLAWLAPASLAAVELGVAALPLVAPMHGGQLLARGMVYSFCEAPERHRLYAVVPECRADRFGAALEACRAGYLEEFDTRDLSTPRVYHLFDEEFYGRMEQVACIGDRIQIGMENTVLDGQFRREHVIELPMDEPELVDRDPLRGRGGARVVYDEAAHRVYYIDAFISAFHRLDFDSGEVVSILENGPFARGSTSAALHRGRRSLLVLGTGVEPVGEFDLETLELKRRYPQTVGVEIAVDEQKSRLLVSGFWGLEVYDLATGERIARRRLGFVGRQAAVAPAAGLVFVPAFFEGKIRVYDRESLELLGKIPIGMYVRYPYVSADGKRLYASSLTAHYYWDLDRLEEAFRKRSAFARFFAR